MEIENNKTKEVLFVSDEKWESLKRMGWRFYWTPVKKSMDENMRVSIHAEKIEMPKELITEKAISPIDEKLKKIESINKGESV